MGMLPPLKTSPLIKPLPWGGRKLETMFCKLLPAGGAPCGESWEVVDLPEEQCVVTGEGERPTTLSALVRHRREELLAETPLLMGRFPVLFKLIDARENLSVQVHPDEEACQVLGMAARPKTEAWSVLHADLGARLYLGLLAGVGKEELRRAIEAGTVADLLCPVTVQKGDFVYVPAGMLHAIGAGIVLAEIQQSSDTTYRVFDWNRTGPDGQKRPLHVAEALASIRFEQRGMVHAATPFSGRPGVRCRHFSFERVTLRAREEMPLDGGKPRILFCEEGGGQLSQTGAREVALRTGETCIVPACRAGSLDSAEGGVFLLIRV